MTPPIIPFEALRRDLIELGELLAKHRLKRQLAKDLDILPTTLQNYLDGFISEYPIMEFVAEGAIRLLQANGIPLPEDLHSTPSLPAQQDSVNP